MNRVCFIARKEFYHIMRDPRSLLIVFLMPILMAFLFGYAINLDIENIILAVVDQDQSPQSRELLASFYESGYFEPPVVAPDLSDPEAILRSGRAYAVILIRPGLAESLQRGQEYQLGLLIDGSDVTMAAAVQAYSSSILYGFLQEHLGSTLNVPRVQLSQSILYNPDLKSSHFFVPGLVAVILLMISALLTSITIAREKETGTMEQLLTAPVRPREILLGKLIPYIVIAFIDGLMVLVFAMLVFGMPFRGSFVLLLAFELIYVAAALSIGILISSLVRTQQVAMMLALVTTLLPSVMLSGFIFAVKNMPLVLKAISTIIPATYFLKIIRGIMLKGAGFDVLWPQGGLLLLIMAVLMIIANKKFKTQAN